MHELSYITRMCNLAAEVAKENGAKAIKTIEIDIGKSSGVLAFYMHKYFPEAAKGTMLEGAELICNEIPVTALCEICGSEYIPSREFDYLCPDCGGRKAHIIAGRDVTLKNVVIETEEDGQ